MDVSTDDSLSVLPFLEVRESMEEIALCVLSIFQFGIREFEPSKDTLSLLDEALFGFEKGLFMPGTSIALCSPAVNVSFLLPIKYISKIM